MANVISAVPKEALNFIKEISEKDKIYVFDKLYPRVCKELNERWPIEQRDIFLGQLRMENDEQIKEAIYVYCQSLNWKDVLSNQSNLRDIKEGAIKYIHAIAHSYNANDRSKLFQAVCSWLDAGGDNKTSKKHYEKFENFGVVSISDIYYAIDLYYAYRKFGVFQKAPAKPVTRYD